MGSRTVQDGNGGAATFATNVQFIAKNPRFSGNERITLVLLNYSNCVDGPSYAPETKESEQSISLTSSQREFVGRFSQDLPTSYSGRASCRKTYRQEIAVVVDDTWLTDPINGTHNFHIDLSCTGFGC